MFLSGPLINNNVLHYVYFIYAILLLLSVACNFYKHCTVFLYFITDVDECATSNGGCHANAGCTNNIGKPRTCKCKLGFSGDGITCGGM